MNAEHKKNLVWLCIVVLVLICGLFSASCTPITASAFIKPKPIEDAALEKAVIMCEKFGHLKGTTDFTKCAEKRYDEYILNNR